MSAWPVAIVTDNNVSCGVSLWRAQGRLFMTVIVKARFSLAHERAVVHMPPVDIVREDRFHGRVVSRSLEAASDLVPYLARCDVTFTGAAYAPQNQPTSASSVRLAVFRDGRPLLDKTLHVFGDRRGNAQPAPFTKMPVVYERAAGDAATNPVGTDAPNIVDPRDARRPGGFGAISRRWPARTSLLGALDPETLNVAIPDFPDAMPWAYYQAAPADQQIEYLRGDEWIVLDHLHPTLPRLQTQLTPARGMARVVARHGAETPVELVADTLTIDGERQQCTVVWRGRHEVTDGESSLSSLRVEAVLEMPGRPLAWPAARTASVPAQEDPGETRALADDAPVPNQGVVPFAMASARGDASPSGNVSATPWSATPIHAAPAPIMQQLGTMLDVDGGANTTLPTLEEPRKDVAPFPLPPASASTSASVRTSHANATPWGHGMLAAPPMAIPGEATMLPADLVTPAEASPPREVTAPPPRIASPAIHEPPAPPLPVTSAPPRADVSRSSTIRAARSPAPEPPPAPPRREPAPAAAPIPERKAPMSPESLTTRLQRAGASMGDIDALMKALQPPAPPPPEDL